jgi:hypothetical protein
VIAFWLAETFAPFVPYLRAGSRGGAESTRCDLAASAPRSVVQAALMFEAPCVACGRTMHPFRQRDALSTRSPRQSPIYLALTCPSDERAGCSRGNRAAAAYKSLWAFRQGRPQPPGQGTLL